MKRLLWCSLLLALSCGPNPPAPVKVMAVLPNVDGTYAPRQVDLTTVTNVTTLQGTAVSLLGGNRVVFDSNDPALAIGGGVANQSDAQRYEILVRDKGAEPRAQYIERSGVLWPQDFHSWNMVSTFYNFERAQAYFVAIYNGKETKTIENQRVMYWADVRIESPDSLVDNALYLPFVKSFAIAPTKNNSRIPLSSNIGVVGHEFAHRVFNERALGAAGVPAPLVVWETEPFNLLKSLDEGLADFHGWAVTCREEAGCRPNFLTLSLDDQVLAEQRNVARQDLCNDDNLDNAFRRSNRTQWLASNDLYKYGSLWAAALYQAGNKAGANGVQTIQRGLIDAYDDESPATPGLKQLISRNLNTPSNFTPEAVAAVIANHLPKNTDVRRFACNEMLTRVRLRDPEPMGSMSPPGVDDFYAACQSPQRGRCP
jgi:hypothetical protein